MWEKDARNFSHKNDVKLVALSPSSFRYNEFLKNIHLNKYDVSNYESAKIENSNLYSVAMQISIVEFNILLGADLLAIEQPNCGWNNIIQNQKSKSAKSNIYKIYKVAHHGSKHSDQDEIWTDLLTRDPVSIVTPKTDNDLPDICVMKRIIGKSERVYITNGYHIKSKCREVIKNGKTSKFTEYTGDITNESFVCVTIDMKKNSRIRVKLGKYANQLKCDSGEIILNNITKMSYYEKFLSRIKSIFMRLT